MARVAVVPDQSSNTYIDALTFGGYVWTDSGTYQAPVTIGWHLSNDYETWSAVERVAFQSAFQSFAAVANITFVETSNPDAADLIEYSVAADVIDGNLGEHETPLLADVPGNLDYAHGYFNYEGTGWDYGNPTGGLSVGGFGYWTVIHELGHGLGLAHPHDNGGGSGIFPGVTGEFTTGTNGLNQGIWTMMSYNATQDPSTANQAGNGKGAWELPNGNDVLNYGYFAGPMAFDIAALQFLYGANTSYHTGNDTYVLPDANTVGTYWTCIWDAGGSDTIAYNGTRNVTIDLLAATLDNSPTGGGVISSAEGIHGGFTIANGAVIEKALGGSGNDTLRGNAAINELRGRGGNDTYFVQNTGDVVIEDAQTGGEDTVISSVNYTLGAWVDNLTLTGNVSLGTGNGDNNILDARAVTRAVTLNGQGGIDVLYGSNFNDTLNGGAGDDMLYGEGGLNNMAGGLNNDFYSSTNRLDVITEAANQGFDTLAADYNVTTLVANVEELIIYGAATIGNGNNLDNSLNATSATHAMSLNGFGGTDTLYGSDFGDWLIGGTQNDTLYGGGGADNFVFAAGTGADRIADFQNGIDHIDVRGRGFSAASIGSTILIGGGANALITIGPDTFRLTGVSQSAINAADFAFA